MINMKIRALQIIFLAAISASVFCQDPPHKNNRLALLIGNGNYNIGMLANPENDVRAMKTALENRGFDVLKYENLNQKQMKMAIDLFGVQLKNYEVGLFFYAGHGIQVKGYNYLVPVDANLTTEQQVEYDCVQVDRILALMEGGGTGVNIIILDACRNNPFERSWSRSANSKGLAFMNAPQGTLIAYATAPGSTASDGAGQNGLYTEAILQSINIQDATILQMFQNVRSIVSAKSGKQQIPWESTSLTGDFYFNLDYTAPDAVSADVGSNFQQQVELENDLFQTKVVSDVNVLDQNPGLFNGLDDAPKAFFTGANRSPIVRITDESENEIFSKDYSDEFFIYKAAILGSNLSYQGKKVSNSDIKQIMAKDSEALSTYRRAINVKRTHQVMFFGGFALFLADYQDNQLETYGAIGTGLTVCSLIPMIVSTKLFNESFEVFHKTVVKNSIIQANPNGVGLKIVF